MATIRQKKAAKLVAENFTKEEPLTGGEIVESSGYGPSMKQWPGRILNSEGVREELKVLGFDSETAKSVVAEILIAGENDMTRLAAAREVFKVNGDYAPEKRANFNMDVPPPISQEDRDLIELLKQNDRNAGTETL